MDLSALPPEWRDRLLKERREARRAAAVFAAVCANGDAEKLYDAGLLLDESSYNAWYLAMTKVGKLPAVGRDIQEALLSVWVERKNLALDVGNRRVLLNALRRLMPCDYKGPALTLYRGTRGGERRRHIYGFSWSTDLVTARKFTERWVQGETGAIVLQATVSADAILLVRNPEDYYDEGEVVVDPFRIGKVKLLERITV